MNDDDRDEYLSKLNAVEDEVRELEELTTGRMYGEPLYPATSRYQSIYATLAWLKERCG